MGAGRNSAHLGTESLITDPSLLPMSWQVSRATWAGRSHTPAAPPPAPTPGEVPREDLHSEPESGPRDGDPAFLKGEPGGWPRIFGSPVERVAWGLCWIGAPPCGVPLPPPPSLGAREQAQGSVSPQAPPAWLSCVLLGGGGWWRGTATVCQNCLWAERGSGVARLELTHSGSFEMALHLRRLQQHGGEVAFFTESLWLRGWSCCGQRG